MASKTEKWFKPKRESGFDHRRSVEWNLRTMYRHAPKNWTPYRKWILVGRQAQALANVTKDRPTEKKAKAVAKAAFAKARRAKK